MFDVAFVGGVGLGDVVQRTLVVASMVATSLADEENSGGSEEENGAEEASEINIVVDGQTEDRDPGCHGDGLDASEAAPDDGKMPRLGHLVQMHLEAEVKPSGSEAENSGEEVS